MSAASRAKAKPAEAIIPGAAAGPAVAKPPAIVGSGGQLPSVDASVASSSSHNTGQIVNAARKAPPSQKLAAQTAVKVLMGNNAASDGATVNAPGSMNAGGFGPSTNGRIASLQQMTNRWYNDLYHELASALGLPPNSVPNGRSAGTSLELSGGVAPVDSNSYEQVKSVANGKLRRGGPPRMHAPVGPAQGTNAANTAPVGNNVAAAPPVRKRGGGRARARAPPGTGPAAADISVTAGAPYKVHVGVPAP